ncbi:type II toxin-antitoxin system RelE/ParE family toxin [Spirulina subsalsa]|uniref:type II toxin-antitoxin system RelE/ParE family toxin n=1 Tax=Spirulina subsalsa TaxID=54311 RepID=UPI003B50BBF9
MRQGDRNCSSASDSRGSSPISKKSRTFSKPGNLHFQYRYPRNRIDDYIIFYRVRGEMVEILRVVHGRQDLEELFKL